VIPAIPVFAFESGWLVPILLVAAAPLAFFVLYTAIVCILFLPTMLRVFDESPVVAPPDEEPDPRAVNVRFQAADGASLQGSWLAAAGVRRGVVIFCHEFLANRWSCRPYCDPLQQNGYDIFTFDFRGHGESNQRANYLPMQYVSNHELQDVQAAIAHVCSRSSGEPPWIGLIGVSRGGGAAILAAAGNTAVRAVATDGAFPTNLAQLAYMLRWAKIYVGEGVLYRITPDWYYSFLCWIARFFGARRHGCRFLQVTGAVGKLSSRPLLMIHGAKDNLVAPEVARQLFDLAGEPKQFWLVSEARHNGAIQVARQEYGRRLLEFFGASHS